MFQWCDDTDWIGLPKPGAGSPPGDPLDNPNPTAGDNFGRSVAVSGSTAVVGAFRDGPGGAGTAYVFDTDTGNLLATLNNPDPTADDLFGLSVAVSGSIAVVGAPQDDPGGVNDAGTAYVFDTATGNLVATLNNPDPTADDEFGRGVAVSGSTAVVGAYADDPGGVSAAGTAYVFDTATGNLIATLNNPDPTISDAFGYSVAVSGSAAVVGAYADDPGGVNGAGAAYVFDTTTGNLIATLNNPAPAAGDNFGYSVAVSGSTAVVGAISDDPGGVSNAGTAYVFDTADGSLIATLNNPDPAADDNFGGSVAVSGSAAVVGASFDDPGGVEDAGAAYAFDIDSGNLLATLISPNPDAGDCTFGCLGNFGASVAVSGSTAVVGAYQDDSGAVDGAGNAYMFDVGGGGGTGCSGPAGAGGDLLYNEDHAVFQWCDGTQWIGFPKPAAAGGVTITAGTFFSCGIMDDGTAWCWGSDREGMLGDGTGATGYKLDPVQVSDAGPWRTISGGTLHVCAVKSDGAAWCWGSDGWGQLGNGATTGSQEDPVQVSDAGPWAAISAGYGHSCGIKTGGSAWCWGYGGSGELGNGGTANQPDPVQLSEAGPWQAISAGDSSGWRHSCGIKDNGTAWCWGDDGSGKLGNGATTGQQNDPVQVSDAGPWQAISAGSNHSCGIKSDGTAWCWGSASQGELGNGATTGQEDDPVQVSGAGPWKVIDAGIWRSCGIKDDGTAWCWGYGTGSAVPVQISEAGPWAAISLSGYDSISASIKHTCGIKDDGTAWCWGENYDGYFEHYGQLGHGATDDKVDPTEVSNPGPWMMPGDGASGPACTAGEAGSILYNADYSVFQWCDGTQWIGFKKPDYTPSQFTFTDLTGQALNTLIESNVVQIAGMSAGLSAAISISGASGSPEYQICDDASCNTVNHAWSSTAGSVDAGEYVQIRLTTANAYETMRSATLTVGGVSDQWDVTTQPAEKIVFVTSAAYNGNLGGISGADDKCNALAAAASLSGTFKAWISTASGFTAPAVTFTQASVPYKLTTGTTVANDWADLVDGTLAAAINVTESGGTYNGQVWTNVATDGTLNGSVHCSSWTTGSGGSNRGAKGSSSATNSDWTAAGGTDPQCNSELGLYCFEQ